MSDVLPPESSSAAAVLPDAWDQNQLPSPGARWLWYAFQVAALRDALSVAATIGGDDGFPVPGTSSRAIIEDFRRQLAWWLRCFDALYCLRLPPHTSVQLAPLMDAYGRYECVSGSHGRDVITINVDTLDRPLELILRTLLHEAVHCHQFHYGRPGRRPTYHNQEYIRLAARCGLMVDHEGRTLQHTAAFLHALRDHAIPFVLTSVTLRVLRPDLQRPPKSDNAAGLVRLPVA